VRSFKPYMLSATAFAVILTVLVINKDIAAFVSQFDVLVFVPIVMGILLSGNAHMPSAFGAYLGFFIQWFVLGLALAAVVWALTRIE
jgi:hypothetical protein